MAGQRGAAAAADAGIGRLQILFTLLCFVLLLTSSPALSVDSNGKGSPSYSHHDAKAIAYSRRGLANAHRLSSPQRSHRTPPTIGEDADGARTLSDYILGDLLVVSSIEGGIYGLDRETGRTIWSLPPRSAGGPTLNQTDKPFKGHRAVQGFGPLVGTSYGPKQRSFSDLAADLPLIDAGPVSPVEDDGITRDGSSGQEALKTLQELGMYIVEPSNGHVYVLTTPLGAGTPTTPDDSHAKTSLTKLPLTLPQLVELSPFSFPGDASRVFVGHKSTSLVELDVRSGQIGAVFGGAQGASGVWCSAEAAVNGTTDNCGQDDDTSREWAYMGRTDYTLTIHLRGRPALSQTLHYSTFSPNAADRDVADLWLRQTQSPDRRSVMGMPEEGTILCFNSSMTATSPRQQQDRTLWIRELGVTVAGVFDVVYPSDVPGSDARTTAQPLILPHPKGTLDSLFSDVPTSLNGRKPRVESTMDEPATYLGIADGQLYAMGSDQYPLVAFTPRAPAGYADEEAREAFHDHHTRGASTCASYGCLLGSYDVPGGAQADELLGLGPGQTPLLGIGDGSDMLPSEAEEYDGTSERHDEQPKKDSKDRSATSWTSPSMILAQIIVLFLLAVLCGLLYVGGQELRRQHAEEARVITKDVVWTPLPPQNAADEKSESPTALVQKEAYVTTPDASAAETAKPEANAADVLNASVEEKMAIGPSAPDAEQNEILPQPSKKKPTKRRKRGKRAGAIVAQREAKKDANGNDEANDESDEDGAGANGEEPAAPAQEAIVFNGGEESKKADADAEVAQIAAKASLTAEGGSQVALTNGGTATVRGSDRSLLISEEILGYGSSGTVVFKGTFQGRAVAVKRLLRDFVDVAAKEVSLLESADNHANVIRYFYKEVTESFLFIALELCPASLSDIIEKPRDFQELSAALKPKRALFQIGSGLQHLHSLSIVHRDIKPQNILVSHTPTGQLKMLLSDFGLSKRLDGAAQTSFSQTVNNPGGTFGWRAPEILRGDVTLDAGAETGSSTVSSSNTATDACAPDEQRKRLTRAVDIFAMGCLTYYVLSNGDHPFGSRFEREMNILKRQIDLQRLDGLGEEGHEAQHLITAMVSFDAHDRPTALQVMAHPYFWDAGRRLAFLQDASDRFDIMDRDPPAAPLAALEENTWDVLGGQDWHKRLDRQVMEDLNKRRRYDPKSVAALLRAIRNKKHHIHDLPPNVKRLFTAAGGMRNSMGGGTGSNSSSFDGTYVHVSAQSSIGHQAPLLPDGFLAYFTSRFPRLFLHTYGTVKGFAVLQSEPSFAAYFAPMGAAGLDDG